MSGQFNAQFGGREHGVRAVTAQRVDNAVPDLKLVSRFRATFVPFFAHERHLHFAVIMTPGTYKLNEVSPGQFRHEKEIRI